VGQGFGLIKIFLAVKYKITLNENNTTKIPLWKYKMVKLKLG